MKIIFLGFGTISRIICEELKGHEVIACSGFLDPMLSDEEKAKWQESGLLAFSSLEEVLAAKPDVVVEAANQDVARTCVGQILAQGINVVSLSVGAYIDHSLLAQLWSLAHKPTSGKLLIPSGALPGVDVLKAAMVRPVYSVELTTRKPLKALLGAPGLENQQPFSETEAVTLFDGTAAEAIKLYPKNVNIAATLSLAGIGPEKTKVKIIVDPHINVNIHTVKVSGEFGRYEATLACEPSSNPKTSMIAPLSAVALLKNLASPISLGT